MSLNWVTTQDDSELPFVPLPDEGLRYRQAEPVVVELTPLNQPKAETTTIKGTAFLTSHRIVVLSTDHRTIERPDNFSLLYKDITSHKLDMPWFGSNRYRIVFRISNPNGGLNYLYQWEARVIFKEGGAVRFAEHFGSLKTRIDNNQEDELPAYSE